MYRISHNKLPWNFPISAILLTTVPLNISLIYLPEFPSRTLMHIPPLLSKFLNITFLNLHYYSPELLIITAPLQIAGKYLYWTFLNILRWSHHSISYYYPVSHHYSSISHCYYSPVSHRYSSISHCYICTSHLCTTATISHHYSLVSHHTYSPVSPLLLSTHL